MVSSTGPQALVHTAGNATAQLVRHAINASAHRESQLAQSHLHQAALANQQQLHHQQLNQHHLQHAVADPDEKPLNPLLAILLIYGVLLLMLGAQAALFLWRKRHQRSYDLVTLVGLWLIPPTFCIQLHFWRFLTVWTLYSCVTGYLLSLCLKKKMDSTTPRLVYTWFLGAYRVSLAVGMAGYALLVAELLGAGPLLQLLLPRGAALDLLWYGLYFGVLGRDCAEVASDRMASAMGSQGRRLLNNINSCGICGNDMQDFSHMGEQASEEVEKCVQLSCKHCFHELCVRGWTMVGKKDTCPVCCEKVDLRALYADRPWETRNLSWIQMLDTVRYLVVWNPIILLVLSVVFHFVAPHHHSHVPPHLQAPSPAAALGLAAAHSPGNLTSSA